MRMISSIFQKPKAAAPMYEYTHTILYLESGDKKSLRNSSSRCWISSTTCRYYTL